MKKVVHIFAAITLLLFIGALVGCETQNPEFLQSLTTIAKIYVVVLVGWICFSLIKERIKK